MHIAAIVTALSALLSCIDATRIEPPPTDGAASALLIVISRQTIDLFAADASAETGRIEFPAFTHPLESGSKMIAVAYDRTLDQLGLEPGQVAIGGDRPLPPATRIFALESLDEGAPWRPLAGPPPELASIRLPPAEPRSEEDLCDRYGTRFRVAALPLEASSEETSLYLGIPFDPSTALVATPGGEFFLVTATRVEALVNTPTTTPHGAAFRTDDGEIWLVGLDGRTVRGRDPRQGLTEGPRMTSRTTLSSMWMSGARGAPLELYALTDEAFLERFDGQNWSAISDGDPRGMQRNHRGVAWIGPGEAMAVGLDASSVTHVLRDPATGTTSVRMEHVLKPNPETMDDEFLSTIADVPGIGVVAGTSHGRFFLRGVEEWSEIPGSPFARLLGANIIKRISPHGDGFLIAGQDGKIAEYHPIAGFCTFLNVAQNDVRDLVPIDRGYVVIAERRKNVPPVVTVLLR